MAGEQQEKLALAMQALNRADFPAALALLGEVVVEDASNGEAWLHLGVCYLETRRPDLALEALERAVQAAPRNPTAHYVLGNACGTLGQMESARDCYRRALEIDPHHAKAEEFLVRTESLLESRQHFRNALAVLASEQSTAQELNRALRELVQSAALFENSPAGDYLPECARRLLAFKKEKIVEPAETPPFAPWLAACERGSQCVRFKNWVGARAAFEEALEYGAGDAFVHHALGFAFVELGETALAVHAWLRVLELEPEYDFASFGRVKAPNVGPATASGNSS
jgi:tetratricopeptide (TPR) repeat protein